MKKGVSSEGQVMSEKIFYFGVAVVSLRRYSVAEPEPVGAEIFWEGLEPIFFTLRRAWVLS